MACLGEKVGKRRAEGGSRREKYATIEGERDKRDWRSANRLLVITLLWLRLHMITTVCPPHIKSYF